MLLSNEFGFYLQGVFSTAPANFQYQNGTNLLYEDNDIFWFSFNL